VADAVQFLDAPKGEKAEAGDAEAEKPADRPAVGAYRRKV